MFFDIATRPTTAEQVRRTGARFDWRLTPPEPAQELTATLYATRPATVDVQLLAVYGLVLEPTLHTAVVHSLFTDGRAGADDVLPQGTTRRGGWVGSEFMPPTTAGVQAADSWGSRLWLGWAGKQTPTRLEEAKYWATEGLAWMVRDGVAERIEAEAEWRDSMLALRPIIYRPGEVLPAYDVLWGITMSRGASA